MGSGWYLVLNCQKVHCCLELHFYKDLVISSLVQPLLCSSRSFPLSGWKQSLVNRSGLALFSGFTKTLDTGWPDGLMYPLFMLLSNLTTVWALITSSKAFAKGVQFHSRRLKLSGLLCHRNWAKEACIDLSQKVIFMVWMLYPTFCLSMPPFCPYSFLLRTQTHTPNAIHRLSHPHTHSYSSYINSAYVFLLNLQHLLTSCCTTCWPLGPAALWPVCELRAASVCKQSPAGAAFQTEWVMGWM